MANQSATPLISKNAQVVQQSPMITSVKVLSEMPNLKTLPSHYAHPNVQNEPSITLDTDQCSIPTIDLSLLSSTHPDQRAKAVHDLGKACEDWGFFMLVNHGISETLMKAAVEATDDFFEMPEAEKQQFQGKNVLDPIRYGTSVNTSKDDIFFWRDHLKLCVHPVFHSPHQPNHFSDILSEYCEKSREVGRKLLASISESLGLEEELMDRTLDLGSSFDVLVANYYPPCPQPELALGLPAHSDFGLLTLLIQNEVGGLQVHHNGKWINIHPIPNSILVNTADHLEIFTNGKYKSVLHRAMVNKVKRISIGFANCPALEATVGPADSPLIQSENSPPLYVPMTFINYLKLQQSNQLNEKSCLDKLKIISSNHSNNT